MYNGIGLPSTRGTATSGHVQSNRAYVRPSSERHRTKNQREQHNNESKDNKYNRNYNKKNNTISKKNNDEINEHEKKRKFENHILELQIQLEDGGRLSSKEIQTRIRNERDHYNKSSSKRNASKENDDGDEDKIQINDPHEKIIKDDENDRMKFALGIKDNHKVGYAFDREMQEKEQEERRAKYEEKQRLSIEQGEVVQDKTLLLGNRNEDEGNYEDKKGRQDYNDKSRSKSNRGRSTSRSFSSSSSSRSYSSSSSSSQSYSSSSSSSRSSYSSQRRNKSSSSKRKRSSRRRRRYDSSDDSVSSQSNASSNSSSSSRQKKHSAKRDRRSS